MNLWVHTGQGLFRYLYLMHSQKVDFVLSVRISGALKLFSQNAKTRYKALKQLAFLNAEHLKRFSPEMLNLVRKTLFASLSFLAWRKG